MKNLIIEMTGGLITRIISDIELNVAIVDYDESERIEWVSDPDGDNLHVSGFVPELMECVTAPYSQDNELEPNNGVIFDYLNSNGF